MKAAVRTHYGPPQVLQLKEVDRPAPAADELLVKVHATSVNRTDCHNLDATPFFMRLVLGLFRPKKPIPGTSFAGEIVEVGSGISSLKPGDRVFGFDDEVASAQAEYLTITEDKLVVIPDNIGYGEAAASPEGGHYALNFINKVDLKPGEKVLVYGASGAIGSAGVQLLKHFGAEVTAVCSARHVEVVKSLGADRIIDYTREDFSNDAQRYAFVMDAVGKVSFFKCKKLLQTGGAYASSDLGFLAQNLYLPLLSPLLKLLFGNRYTIFPLPVNIKHSLLLLQQLMAAGEFKPLIDREYPFEEIVAAYQYVQKGHKTGNVVIDMT
jgi:NADPH:quinone reductase-like Zn-dependent oxidoreductase